MLTGGWSNDRNTGSFNTANNALMIFEHWKDSKMAMNGHIFETQCEVGPLKTIVDGLRVSRGLFYTNRLNAHIVIELAFYYLIMWLDRARGGSLWEGTRGNLSLINIWGIENRFETNNGKLIFKEMSLKTTTGLIKNCIKI